MVEAVVVAVAERMLEYTLDVVKLEPGETKCSPKTVPEENQRTILTVFPVTNNERGETKRCHCKISFSE